MRLIELRSNPDKNPRVDVLEVLEQYKDDDTAFITFTDIEKIGVHPRSPYRTPIGIYAYPLREIWQTSIGKFRPEQPTARTMTNMVPFAGGRRYVTLFKVRGWKDIATDLESYTVKNLEKDVENIRKLLASYEIEDWVLDKSIEAAKTAFKGDRPFGRLWFIAHEAAKIICLFTERQGNEPVVWNAIFRAIGYNGVVDAEGMGVIHPNEPVQAVFFSKKPIEIIGTYENKVRSPNASALAALRSLTKHVFKANVDTMVDEAIDHVVAEGEYYIPGEEKARPDAKDAVADARIDPIFIQRVLLKLITVVGHRAASMITDPTHKAYALENIDKVTFLFFDAREDVHHLADDAVRAAVFRRRLAAGGI